jgi:FtsH-binding integral membrane protein
MFLNSYGLTIFFAIAAIVLTCVLVCIPSVARAVPSNYILMFIFTFCEAWVVAYVCAAIGDAQTVLMAAFMTAGIVVGLTLYAITTKTDFTFCGGSIFIIAAAMIMFSILSIIFGATFNLVYCTLGVILFGFYLVFDTQLIVGGKRNATISKEDYILAAMMLYLDIINIFLYILRILSNK